MTNNNLSSTAVFLWSVADLLQGHFKQPEYSHIIQPFTLLRRSEYVLKSKFLRLEAKAINVIDLMKERKTALISAVTSRLMFVTGKHNAMLAFTDE